MSLSEQLGIPNPPPRPSNVDYQLARFVTDDAEKHPSGFCGRCLLSRADGYGNSASVIRKKGWVRQSAFGVKFGRGKPIFHYFLTDTGKAEAKAAVDRIDAYKARQAEWTEQFKAARAAITRATLPDGDN